MARPVNAPVLEVILYTRPGCHLCEEVRDELQALAPTYPHRLQEVDITGDRELHARYHLTIPVVAAAGRELAAPITAGQLQTFLRDVLSTK